ncbi:hypothetical protein [uncultured Dokdonia sp.]|uniref:hypothetical protein n=1 Tax=uncultured Dokdonia sp. TaxID=575653 RepID=UPI0026271708|nr:hypothetical protein [uncultured Dokdonia sp.]
MLKKIKNLNGVQTLSQKAQKNILGGWGEICLTIGCFSNYSQIGGGSCVIQAPAGQNCIGNVDENGQCCVGFGF